MFAWDLDSGEYLPMRTPGVLISGLFLLLMLPLLYNSLLHPLAKVPGPFFAKFTDLWHAYQVTAGNRHKLLYDLHKTYGPLVRIGPNTISTDTNEGLQKIYSATAPIDKSPFYQAFSPKFKSSFASTGHYFKEKKTLLSPAFSQKKLDAMEVTFMKHTRRLCDAMIAQKEVELDEGLSALTIDILSDVCFGESFNLIDNPSEKTLVSAGLVQAAKYISLEGTLWRWPILQSISRNLSCKYTTREYAAKRAIMAMINQRQNPTGRDDIFNYLLTATNPASGEPFPDNELFGEAIILFVAGSDTTSTSLLTILWHLMRHRETYDTVAKEVRSKFRTLDDLTFQEAQKLPFLRAVIEEGLRIFPPNSGFIPRQVIDANVPFVLHGTTMPIGNLALQIQAHKFRLQTEVGVANMALHRNPLFFENPDSFAPERWIGKNGSLKKDKSAFSPFSKGPRSCLGRTMAYMEMTLVLAALFIELDMEFQDPEMEARQGYTATDSFVLVRPKVKVLVSGRKP